MSTYNNQPTIKTTGGSSTQGTAPQGPVNPAPTAPPSQVPPPSTFPAPPPPSGQVGPTVVQGQAGYGYSPGSADAGATQVIRARVRPTFAYLIVRDGFRAGQVFSLLPEVTTVGRLGDNDVALDDPAISNHHLKICSEKDDEGKSQFVLYDLASANGTQVNGEEALKHPLTDGDEVEIGQTHLVFKQI